MNGKEEVKEIMDKFDEFLESLKETKSNEKLSEGFKEN